MLHWEVPETSQKMIKNWEKVILIILEIFYGIESREGKETLRTMFRMPNNCLIFLCLSLDFFVIFQDKLQYWLIMAFLCFTAWLVHAKQLWQHCLICWQQADHVEIYVALFKTISQVR